MMIPWSADITSDKSLQENVRPVDPKKKFPAVHFGKLFFVTYFIY